jgi:4-amino-4-deoxy-L-arabinose transferase-like glycosyltransferase
MLLNWTTKGLILQKKVMIVFLAAIVLRFAVFLQLYMSGGTAPFLFGDSIRYLTLADNVLSGVGFMYDGIFESFRLPGYPAFFMILRLLDLPLIVGSIIQIVIASCFAVWAVWFVRTRLQLSERASLAAGFFVALEPVQAYYSVILLPDVIYAAFFLTVFTLAILWMERGGLQYAVFIGIAIGVANYVRPAMLYLPFVLTLTFVGYKMIRRERIMPALQASAIIFAITFLCMFPWNMRNYALFGHFKSSSTTEQNIYFYNAAAIEASVRGVPYATVKKEFVERTIQEAPSPHISTFENSEYYKERAIERIAAHPFVFAKLYILGATAFWTSGNYQYIFKNLSIVGPPSQSISYSMLLSSQGIMATIGEVAQRMREPFIMLSIFDRIFGLLIFAAFLAGLYIHRYKPETWLVCMLAAYYSATILPAVLGIEARHRYSMIPIMLCFVVACAVAAWRILRRRRMVHLEH